MSDSTASLRRKIKSAGDLQSVVRTMKALAASSVVQYDRSAHALGDYYKTVLLGLSVAFRNAGSVTPPDQVKRETGPVGAVVFGSDQGLVGQFNDVIADHAIKILSSRPEKPRVWAVGERVHARLEEAGLTPFGLYAVPNSVDAITPLVGRILIEGEESRARGDIVEVQLFYNRPLSGALYEPISQRLLPLDEQWRRGIAGLAWPTKNLPQVVGDETVMLRALIREYLFVSLFRACADSLASENGSRLAAMQRADKNIDDLLEGFNRSFHMLRQNGIDGELFDLVAGFEALPDEKSKA